MRNNKNINYKKINLLKIPKGSEKMKNISEEQILINDYFEHIIRDKNEAIQIWKKSKKEIKKVYKLGFTLFLKYILMNFIEYSRYFLHIIKINIQYIIVSFKFLKVKRNNYNIISDEETVDKIVNQRYSIARFGDGEFKWILGVKQNSFQNDSIELSKRLKDILRSTDNDKLLIGINGCFNHLDNYVLSAKLYWKKFLINYNSKLEEQLPQRIYSDSNITRPYIDYKDKSPNTIQKKFDNLKRIWCNKSIVIVEGKFTKLGVGNDLFDNCTSIERIICPAVNAFDKYDDIIKEIRKVSLNKLILISLGPTATILTYDLSKEGYQCIDTGHIDIEYMWFKAGAKSKEEVKGKFVNEVSKDNYNMNIDEEYLNQIISEIG